MTDEQLVDLMHLLTPEDHQAVEHIIKRLVVLNDPDYTRLTPMEKKELDEALAVLWYIKFCCGILNL